MLEEQIKSRFKLSLAGKQNRNNFQLIKFSPNKSHIKEITMTDILKTTRVKLNQKNDAN